MSEVGDQHLADAAVENLAEDIGQLEKVGLDAQPKRSRARGRETVWINSKGVDGFATRAPEDLNVLGRSGDPATSLEGHAVASPVRDSARLVARTAPTWREAQLANGVQPAPSSATSPSSEVAESLVAPL
jgi:hypothetical protein